MIDEIIRDLYDALEDLLYLTGTYSPNELDLEHARDRARIALDKSEELYEHI